MRIISPAEKSSTQPRRNTQHTHPTGVRYGYSLTYHQSLSTCGGFDAGKNIHVCPWRLFYIPMALKWLFLHHYFKVCSVNSRFAEKLVYDSLSKGENLQICSRPLLFSSTITTCKALFDQSQGSYSELISVTPSSTQALMVDLLMHISLPFEACVFSLRLKAGWVLCGADPPELFVPVFIWGGSACLHQILDRRTAGNCNQCTFGTPSKL